MQLDIISPEAQLFSGQVEAVQFPGLDGSFQVLKDHAPIISALKSGIVSVRLTNKIEKPEKYVQGGFKKKEEILRISYFFSILFKNQTFFTGSKSQARFTMKNV